MFFAYVDQTPVTLVQERVAMVQKILGVHLSSFWAENPSTLAVKRNASVIISAPTVVSLLSGGEHNGGRSGVLVRVEGGQ